MKILRVTGVVLGAMVGLYLWMCSINLLNHNPLGPSSKLDFWVLHSPLLGAFLPGALNLMHAGWFVRGTWLLALAPVVGLLNYGLLLYLMVSTGIRPDPWSLPVLLTIAIWAVPAVPLFALLARNAARRRS